MNNTQFEDEMRKYELFHSIKVGEGLYPVIRVDGRGFSGLTEKHFQKPFDINFHEIMVHVAQTLLVEFNGIYAFTESDEISILLDKSFNAFDRELEKLVSLSASVASVAFSQKANLTGHFDSRIWVGTTEPKVVDYFRWRQTDTERCALNGWAYWTLRTNGFSPNKASSMLKNKTVEDKHRILFDYVVDFNSVPSWQRHGTGLYWENYLKDGFNPRENKVVKVVRRQVKLDENLPTKDDYKKLILDLIGAQSRDSAVIAINS
jgi:tRNA(His) 5'-end guanylyltransferase